MASATKKKKERWTRSISLVKAKADYVQELVFVNLLADGLTKRISDELSRVSRRLLEKRPVAVADAQVYALYSEKLFARKRSLLGNADVICVPAGEECKKLDVLESTLGTLANLGVNRDTHALFAIGGGSTLDLASLCASLYMRGLCLVHVPTTLLAMVDATVGGKTGINAFRVKNLIGTFYPASLSLIDVNFLATLPPRRFKEGVVEALKMGFLAGRTEFNVVRGLIKGALEGSAEDIEMMVELCARLKSTWVEKDFTDVGARRALNLGHTLAHGLEAVEGFNVTHGEAVALGIKFACELSVDKRLTRADELQSLLSAMSEINPSLPKVSVDDDNLNSLWEKMRLDKKHRDKSHRFILPLSPGNVRLVEVTKEQFLKTAKRFFRTVGKHPPRER